MKVMIREIEIGAEYDGKIYDFWIKASLHSGDIITIFDSIPIDLRDRINRYEECLILAGFVSNYNLGGKEDSSLIKGLVVKLHDLSNWTQIRDDVKNGEWYGIENSNGIFLVSVSEAEQLNLRLGSNVNLSVGRFDLLGIK